MKYKQLKQKQLSIEQEKKLEEEINRKLSGIDQILSKALYVNPQIFNEQESINGKEETKHDKGDGPKLNLFRIYRTDELKTTNTALLKSRDAKKDCRSKLKQLIPLEESKK